MNKNSRFSQFFQNALGNAAGQLVYDFITQQWKIWLPGSLIATFFKFIVENQTVAIVILIASFGLSIVLIAYSYARPRLSFTRQQQPAPISPTGNYLTLDFTGASVGSYEVPASPYGVIWSGGIPFRILPYAEGNIVKGHAVVKIGPKHDGSPNRNRIACDVPRVKRVFILWTAGNGWKSFQNVQYEGRRIGILEFVFADGDTQKVPVVLGKNIREWIYRNPNPQGVVDTFSDSSVSQFWTSLEGLHTLDMIRIDIEEPPRDLRAVELVGQFEFPTSISGELLPDFHLSAVTCEIA